jgi:hypothetical protein
MVRSHLSEEESNAGEVVASVRKTGRMAGAVLGDVREPKYSQTPMHKGRRAQYDEVGNETARGTCHVVAPNQSGRR